MIPVMLPSSQIVECSRPGSPVRLQHCPVCGDGRQVRVFRIDRRRQCRAPIGVVIDCPQCQSTIGLWRVLDHGRPT